MADRIPNMHVAMETVLRKYRDAVSWTTVAGKHIIYETIEDSPLSDEMESEGAAWVNAAERIEKGRIL